MTLLDQDLQAPPATHRYRGLAIAAAVLLISVLALAGYLFHLKSSAERVRAHVTESQPVPAPVAGQTEKISIFVPSDSDGNLIRQQVAVAMPPQPQDRARQAVRALFAACAEPHSTHPLPAGAEVTAVYMVGNNLAVVDLNAATADQHPSGILVEQLTLASIAQTVAANAQGVTRIKFLVDGKERETLAGHVSLKDEYEVAALSAALVNENPGVTSAQQR